MSAYRLAITLASLLALARAAQAGPFGPKGEDIASKQATVRAQRDEMLAELVESRPEMGDKLKLALGYATFRQTDLNLFLLASGNGYGLLVDNRTGAETFMRVASLGGGAGMGVRDVRVVFVFHDAAVMQQFIEKGWQFSAKADVSAKYGDTGVAAEQSAKTMVDVETGSSATALSADARAEKSGSSSSTKSAGTGGAMEVFQFTESGVSLQATVAGTKYWKDSKLNP